MGSYILKLIVFIALFVFQTNNGVACGNSSNQIELGGKDYNKNMCISHLDTKNDNCKDCQGDCGGDCGNSSCHCTNSTSVSFIVLGAAKVDHNFYTAQKFWNYNQNLYKRIYLAIWTPPKIG